jgi:hypothetical protein
MQGWQIAVDGKDLFGIGSGEYAEISFIRRRTLHYSQVLSGQLVFSI